MPNLQHYYTFRGSSEAKKQQAQHLRIVKPVAVAVHLIIGPSLPTSSCKLLIYPSQV
jgi:hypothetical protein